MKGGITDMRSKWYQFVVSQDKNIARCCWKLLVASKNEQLIYKSETSNHHDIYLRSHIALIVLPELRRISQTGL